jgi:Tryptophan-rich Synechocystis species C-terminal domain
LNNGFGRFVQWNTDSNGNYVSNGSTIVSDKGYALEASEPDFQQNLNGDGTLGVVSTSIETAGNTKLAQVADMYFVYTGDGSSGFILRAGPNNSGGYFVAGTSGQLLGIEQRADGDYDAMTKVGTDQYEIWQFTSGGTGWGRPFPFRPFSASSFQMQDAENRFQQDFTGNGVIGAGSSGSSGLQLANSAMLLVNYMASAFVSPAGEGAGVVVEAQSSDQDFLTKPVA